MDRRNKKLAGVTAVTTLTEVICSVSFSARKPTGSGFYDPKIPFQTGVLPCPMANDFSHNGKSAVPEYFWHDILRPFESVLFSLAQLRRSNTGA